MEWRHDNNGENRLVEGSILAKDGVFPIALHGLQVVQFASDTQGKTKNSEYEKYVKLKF